MLETLLLVCVVGSLAVPITRAGESLGNYISATWRDFVEAPLWFRLLCIILFVALCLYALDVSCVTNVERAEIVEQIKQQVLRETANNVVNSIK